MAQASAALAAGVIGKPDIRFITGGQRCILFTRRRIDDVYGPAVKGGPVFPVYKVVVLFHFVEK
jgi:hypothetical protein